MKIKQFDKGIISASLGSFWWGFLGTFFFKYISFAGTLDVFCTLPADKAVYLDSSGDPVGAASAGFALAMAVAL